MFLGHYGVAFALKRAEPKISLGTLFIAAQLVDLLWGGFLLLGWEHVRILPDEQPAADPAVLRLPDQPQPGRRPGLGRSPRPRCTTPGRRGTPPGTGRRRRWSGAAVASHWLLDLLVHVPDLPLAGNDSPKVGLGTLASRRPERRAGAAGARPAASRSTSTGRTRRHPVRPVRLAVVLLLLVGIVRRVDPGASAAERDGHRRGRRRVHDSGGRRSPRGPIAPARRGRSSPPRTRPR